MTTQTEHPEIASAQNRSVLPAAKGWRINTKAQKGATA